MGFHPMMREFDPHRLLMQDRREEKLCSRRKDDKALTSGSKTPEQLRKENAHFSGLNVQINLEKTKRLY